MSLSGWQPLSIFDTRVAMERVVDIRQGTKTTNDFNNINIVNGLCQININEINNVKYKTNDNCFILSNNFEGRFRKDQPQ